MHPDRNLGPVARLTNNLWVHNPYPYSIGMPTAFASVVSNDVYLEAAGNAGQGFEWGPATGGVTPYYIAGTVTWSNNIIAHAAMINGGQGISVASGYVVSVVNNILYDWHAPLLDLTAGTTASGNVQDASGANSEGYPDPTRSVGSYAGTFGLTATTSAFLAAARTQSKDNWNTALMASAVNTYIRAGFGIGTSTAPSAPPTADTTPPSVPTALAGTAATATQINLSWTASTDNVGVAGYKVFRNGTQLGTTANTSYSDTGLSAATTYTYTALPMMRPATPLPSRQVFRHHSGTCRKPHNLNHVTDKWRDDPRQRQCKYRIQRERFDEHQNHHDKK